MLTGKELRQIYIRGGHDVSHIINKFISKFYGCSRFPLESAFPKTEKDLHTLIYFTLK